MQFSAKFTMIMGAIFALVCFGAAATGFMSIGEMTDPKQISDSRGFALFWAFLGFVAAAFSGVSWWIANSAREEE